MWMTSWVGILSSGEIDEWLWSFGDGGISAEKNPSHFYTASGVYTVTLTVTASGVDDTSTKKDYITVRDVPTVAFTASPTSGPAPLAVTFTATSGGSPTSWSWDFGDGGTASQQNPVHTYLSAGTYTVTLTVTNECGSDTATGAITVTEPPANRVHIAAVTVDRQTSFFGLIGRGRVRVKVVDAAGSPVAGATVTGRWSGSATDSDTFTTGADGWGTAYSNRVWGGRTFTFCVSQVTKSGWTHDPPANPCGGM
jgi:PKD repeat protein